MILCSHQRYMGKLWWGNAKTPKKGIDKKIENFIPAGLLEEKDWKLIKEKFPLRMIDYGFINKDTEQIKLNIMIRFVLILLPTHYEYILLIKYYNRLLFSLKSLTKKPKKFCTITLNFFFFGFYYIKRVFCFLITY